MHQDIHWKKQERSELVDSVFVRLERNEQEENEYFLNATMGKILDNKFSSKSAQFV